MIYATLIAFNLLVWCLALFASYFHPILLGTALLAYSSACVTRSMPTISPRSTT